MAETAGTRRELVRGSLKQNCNRQKNGDISGLKADLLKLIDKQDDSTAKSQKSLIWTVESSNDNGEEETEEEGEEEEEVEMLKRKNGKAVLKRKKLVFETWGSQKRKFVLKKGNQPLPRKLIKIDKEQKKDDEQRPLPQLLKQVLVSYPAEGAHYSLVMGRDLLSLGTPGSPLSANLLRFGLHYILQAKVVDATVRSSVVLFDSSTFGTIDRYPKLKEAEKKKFRQHHQLGDKEYLVFLVRMNNPQHHTGTNATFQTSDNKQKPAGKQQKQAVTKEADEYIFADELEKEKEQREELGVKSFRNGGGRSGRDDAENHRWHWYLAIVTDITAYQGPPVSGSAIYSTIIFLDANPLFGAQHYKWASAGVRGYLHDIYEDLHGLETGVRLNYRYPRLANSITVLNEGNPTTNSNGRQKNGLLLKNLKNLKVDMANSTNGNSSTPSADSGLLLLAYFEAFMRKDLFRERVAKGVPLGQLNLFQSNSPTFDSDRARQAWRTALFSVIDFSNINRERLLKQLHWTEQMVEETEVQQPEQQNKTARKR